MIILLCTCLAPLGTQPRMLVVFQGRSRHTHGFQPLGGFDLPLLELEQLLPQGARLELEAGDGALCWVEGAEQASVQAACARAILTHSLYAVVATGTSLRGALEGMGRRLDADGLQVVDLKRPHLTRGEAAEVRLGVAAALDGRQALGGAQVADTLLIDGSGRCSFGTCLARGLAGGPGAPGTRPRRRFAGALGRYALKERPFCVPTTMETELALLMASLARCRPGARVLDPCCGSGGLLLSAAALGCRSMVGLDVDADALAGAATNFVDGLAEPAFHLADILGLERAGAGALGPDARFDAILCDPPYGMKVPVRAGSSEQQPAGASTATDEARAQVALVLTALLRLARRALLRGGRLVFFLPVRGADSLLDGADSLRSLLERWAPGELAGLALVAARKQTFSSTFCRWIVIIER